MNLLAEALRRDLTEARYQHSLRVAECAGSLAERFSCDCEKARLAGLLHDCATQYSSEELLDLAVRLGLRSPGQPCENPLSEYHAKLGPYVARRKYGISDPEVLKAIAFHQMGGVPMTALDMVVGLADAIEPSRQGEGVEAIRVIAETDLKRACLEKQVLYMTNTLRSHKPLPEERVRVYQYLLTIV